ncbi:MAG: ATP-binding cassette domain-containing protein [Dehalococcoidia bacterium]|nr:ATP-binding cassette domain-containing protein [Dehalococcoidia bacterium]
MNLPRSPGSDSGARPAVHRTVLEIQALTKRFGEVLAVDAIILSVAQGEVLGLLGPNGSGKSTTLNMILGFVRPTAGRVMIDGHDLERDRRQALLSVGGLVEGSAFYPYLTGRRNLWMLARIRGLPRTSVDEVIGLVDLGQAADRKFGGYSTGMRQRLGVAAALLHDPKLIVLDEPTSGLDPAGTREMRQLIPRIAAEGHTVVLASHLLVEVEQVCQRVAILKQGRIIAEGRVADLLSGDGSLRIRIAESDLAKAQGVLLSKPDVKSVTIDNGDLVVSAAIDGSAVNRMLVQEDIYASRIEPAGRSLESVFLELTEAGGNP